MRKLQTSDIFNVLRLVRQANLKEELKPIVVMASSGKFKIEDVGVEAILTILETFAEKKAEDGIYKFLSGPFEMPAEDISKMDINKLIESLQSLSKENDLKAFFTVLSGMMTKK